LDVFLDSLVSDESIDAIRVCIEQLDAEIGRAKHENILPLEEREALKECIEKKEPDLALLEGKKFLWDANYLLPGADQRAQLDTTIEHAADLAILTDRLAQAQAMKPKIEETFKQALSKLEDASLTLNPNKHEVFDCQY